MKLTIKDRILEALEKHGPATSRQLSRELGVSLGTVPACMSQLRDAGKVRAFGTARYGRSRAQSIVWEKTNTMAWLAEI